MRCTYRLGSAILEEERTINREMKGSRVDKEDLRAVCWYDGLAM